MTLISAVFRFVFIANGHLILRRTKILIKKKKRKKIQNLVFPISLRNARY